MKDYVKGHRESVEAGGRDGDLALISGGHQMTLNSVVFRSPAVRHGSEEEVGIRRDGGRPRLTEVGRDRGCGT